MRCAAAVAPEPQLTTWRPAGGCAATALHSGAVFITITSDRSVCGSYPLAPMPGRDAGCPLKTGTRLALHASTVASSVF